MAEYEKCTTNSTHIIESEQCLVCAETGRVIAVFYNDYDLDEVLGKLNGDLKPFSTYDGDLEVLFQNFWNAGMRKMNPKKARPLFIKLAKSYTTGPVYFTSMLMEDIQERVSINQQGFDAMHPTTYLNGERWNDEIKPSQPINNQAQSLMNRLTDTSWADKQIEGDS